MEVFLVLVLLIKTSISTRFYLFKGANTVTGVNTSLSNLLA